MLEEQEVEQKEEVKSIKVSELNSAIGRLLKDSVPKLWISGEISNWNRNARSGHCYFSLKDDKAQVRCVMWKGWAAKLPMDPEDGMEVLLYGQPTLYERGGEFQVAAERITATGEGGLWKLAFEKLKKKLDQEGLTAPERKRPVPGFPYRIGVVTSASSAAFQDIVRVLGQLAPWVEIVLSPSAVQGEGSAESIARSLEVLYKEEVDVIIVARGGGSIEDLWAFNEEIVARTIVKSPVPVISGVGHETDITIADLVADLRMPTPSAAAEGSVRVNKNLITEFIGKLPDRFISALLKPVRTREDELRRVEDRMTRSIDNLHRFKSEQLARMAGTINALSPLSSLERGYAVPTDTEGHVLRTLNEFEEGKLFSLRMLEGRVEAEVKRTVEDPLKLNTNDENNRGEEQ